MKCPACGETAVVAGRIAGVADSLDFNAACFRPDHLRLLAFGSGIPLQRGLAFHACTACGHVWSRLDPARLRKLIVDSGSAALKAKLAGRKSIG
jgi:hypothetical protein